MAKPQQQMKNQKTASNKGQKTATQTQAKSFEQKLKELATFVNRKQRSGNPIVNAYPNGKVRERVHTRKRDGKTVTYKFEGATLVHKDGTVREKYYLNLPFYLKGEFGQSKQ